MEDADEGLSATFDTRVRLKLDYQAEVEALFDGAGLVPMRTAAEPEALSYWFSKDQEIALATVLESMPLAYWTGHMVAGAPPIQ